MQRQPSSFWSVLLFSVRGVLSLRRCLAKITEFQLNESELRRSHNKACVEKTKLYHVSAHRHLLKQHRQPARKRHSFLSAFPMFVPSLSGQNDHRCTKTASTTVSLPLLARGAGGDTVHRRVLAQPEQALDKLIIVQRLLPAVTRRACVHRSEGTREIRLRDLPAYKRCPEHVLKGQRKEEDQNKKKGTSGRRNKKENRTEGFSSFPTLLRRVSPGGMCFVNETIERLKNNKEAGEKNCPRRNVFSTKLETKAHRWGES